MKKNSTLIGAVLFAVSLVSWVPVEAKVIIFSLAEKAQGSDIVLIGNIKELRDDYVAVTIEKILKGTEPLKEIELAWDKQRHGETIEAQYFAGEHLLLFANKKSGKYVPFMGGQGAVVLGEDTEKQYEAAIDPILKYEASKSTEEITGLLISMLRSDNPILQDVALSDFIYLDKGEKRRDFGIGEREIGKDVVKLTKNSNKRVAIRATQALDGIGGKDSIPTLIELVGDEDESIAQVAARALSSKTRFKKTIERGSTIGERKKIQAEWQEWWSKNKDKVKLRR